MKAVAYVAHFDPPSFDPFEDIPKRRKRRRLSIGRAIDQAKKSGLDLIVDRGDGTRFTFRQGVTATSTTSDDDETPETLRKLIQ